MAKALTRSRSLSSLTAKKPKKQPMVDPLVDALVDTNRDTLGQMDASGVEDDLAARKLSALFAILPDGRSMVDEDDSPSEQLEELTEKVVKQHFETLRSLAAPLGDAKAPVRIGDLAAVAAAMSDAIPELTAVHPGLAEGVSAAMALFETMQGWQPMASPGIRRKLKRMTGNARSANWMKKRFGKVGVALNGGYAKETRKTASKLEAKEDELLDAWDVFDDEVGFLAQARAADGQITHGLAAVGLRGMWKSPIYNTGKNWMLSNLYTKLADFDTGMSGLGKNKLTGGELLGGVLKKVKGRKGS